MNPRPPRQLYHLAGPAAATRRRARAFVATRADTLWVSDHPPDGVRTRTAREITGELGGEVDTVVFDALDGLDVDALAAATGLIRAGGALVVLTPPDTDWPDHRDSAVDRFRQAGAGPFGTAFLRRFRRLLETAAAVAPERLPPLVTNPHPHGDRPVTADQALAVETLTALISGEHEGIGVVTGDRGRGKSAALGLAAAAALERADLRIAITAPRPASAAAIFRHAGRALGIDLPANASRLRHGGGELRFRPPDALADAAPKPDVILVDEAAALPAARLDALVATGARLVFATTVHGYEGSGRGFDLRFRPRLERLGRRIHAQTLAEPIRWGPNDPLERFVDDALLLDAEMIAAPVGDSPTIEPCDRAALVEDEARLHGVFGLLLEAHYQTRPSDLRNLLDHPDMRLWIARCGDAIVGALLTIDEGGFSPAMAARIWTGERRPRGHMMAQSLAVHGGEPDAPMCRIRRVVRIAVHPAHRRAGIGSELLAAMAADSGEGFDALGTSFGVTEDLCAFWRRGGYRLVRVGHRRDSASGTHSAMFLQPTSECGHALENALRDRLARDWPWRLREPLADLPAPLREALAADLPAVRGDSPDARDRELAALFARGGRQFHDVAGALGRLASHAHGAAAATLLARTNATDGGAAWRREHGIAGRRDEARALRALAGELVGETAKPRNASQTGHGGTVS